jgi:hypothetical protein
MLSIWQDTRWLRRLLIAGWILTFLAPLMIMAGVVGVATEWHFIRTALRAEATVVEMVEQSGDNGVMYAPVYTFKDQAGQEQKVHSRCSSYPPAYHVGDKIAVLYRPSSPRDAQIQSFFDMWGWMAIVGGIGIVYGIIGPILLTVVRKQKEKAANQTSHATSESAPGAASSAHEG